MQDKTITVGVIGAGLMGLRHAAIYDAMPGVRLAGVIDTDAAARHRATTGFGVPAHDRIENLLAHPGLDAVSICLPDTLHSAATLAALAVGLHVLLEKPLAMSVTEGEQIRDAARRAGSIFMVGHLLRFDPRYDQARQAVQRGQIGAVAHVYARRNSAIGAAARYGGAVRLPWHVSIHDIDLVRWITGREFVQVTAHASDRRLGAIGHLDSLLALLRLDDGTPCVVESCWVLPAHFKSGIDAQLEVVGTEGVIEVTGLEQGLRVADRAGMQYPDTMRYVESDGGTPGGILKTELEHFIACIRNGRAPLVTAEDGLAAVRVAAAIDEAVASRQMVHMPHVREREEQDFS